MLSACLARLALGCPLTRLAPSTVFAATIHSSAVVERARQSTRIKKRKVYEANKKKKEERLRKNPPPIPKKVQLMLIAKGLGKEPRPWRQRDPKPFPTDDVWAEGKWHTWPRFPLDEAVAMLKEHHHPTMLNQPDALLWAKLEFNLQASKKEKYLDGYSVMVPVLHPFERGVAEKAVLVFARDPEAVKAAEAAGAARVGGLELVDDIAKGKIDVADIDHFLAHEDIELKELRPLLGVLREKMPSKLTGTVGTDLERMVKTFGNGMLVTVVKPKKTLGYEEDPSYGVCELHVGRLGMDPAAIAANLQQALEALRAKAPPRKAGGFVTRCQVYCEGPLQLKFDIHHDLVDDAKYNEHIASLATAPVQTAVEN